MLEFDGVQIECFNLDYLLISWQIKPTIEQITDYGFAIRRSNSPEGQFKLIKEGIINQFVFKDISVSLKKKWQKYYYQIEVYLLSDRSKNNLSDIIHKLDKPDIIAMEIIRRNNLILERFIAVKPSNVYIRRTWGQKCPNCWDVVKQRKTKSSCSLCFNTGILDGFWDPIETNINYNPSIEIIKASNFQQSPDTTIAWLSNYPLLSPKDVILEDGEKRWRIVNVRKTEKQRVVVHQTVQLIRINKNDIEYKLIIPGVE